MPRMRARTFAIVTVAGLAAAALLLALGAALDLPALEYAGLAAVAVVLASRLAWEVKDRGPRAVSFPLLLLAAIAAGFVAQRLFG
jgi:hypothetical protein